jgi:hypothetical protein
MLGEEVRADRARKCWRKIRQNTARIARTVVNAAIGRCSCGRYCFHHRPQARAHRPPSQVSTAGRARQSTPFRRSFSPIVVTAVGAGDVSR